MGSEGEREREFLRTIRDILVIGNGHHCQSVIGRARLLPSVRPRLMRLPFRRRVHLVRAGLARDEHVLIQWQADHTSILLDGIGLLSRFTLCVLSFHCTLCHGMSFAVNRWLDDIKRRRTLVSLKTTSSRNFFLRKQRMFV